MRWEGGRSECRCWESLEEERERELGEKRGSVVLHVHYLEEAR